ncbi:MAG: hypothetical protein E5Y29_14250 [Mesorhizobium sp.]|nr:MAG: hypothetical protein E5Y29_14250 [Mesorhizobium sp.]
MAEQHSCALSGQARWSLPAAADDAANARMVIIGLPKSGSVIIPVDQLTTGDAVGEEQEW